MCAIVLYFFNEEYDLEVSVDCYDCTISWRGCKHTVAFTIKVHRWENPHVPLLNAIGKSHVFKGGTPLKYIIVKELSRRDPRNQLSFPRALSDILEQEKGREIRDCRLMEFHSDHIREYVEMVSMHQHGGWCVLKNYMIYLKLMIDLVYVEISRQKLNKTRD